MLVYLGLGVFDLVWFDWFVDCIVGILLFIEVVVCELMVSGVDGLFVGFVVMDLYLLLFSFGGMFGLVFDWIDDVCDIV